MTQLGQMIYEDGIQEEEERGKIEVAEAYWISCRMKQSQREPSYHQI